MFEFLSSLEWVDSFAWPLFLFHTSISFNKKKFETRKKQSGMSTTPCCVWVTQGVHFVLPYLFFEVGLVLRWVTRTNTGHCCVRLDDSRFLFWQVAVVNRSQAAMMDSNSFRCRSLPGGAWPSGRMLKVIHSTWKAAKSGERAMKPNNGTASQRW